MPDRNRLHQLALGGWLVALLLAQPGAAIGRDDPWPIQDEQPHSNSQDAGKADGKVNDDALKEAFWRPDGKPHKKGDVSTYRALCEEPGYHDNADLCQQWRTAEATERLEKWAEPQFWATIVSIGLIVLSLFVSAWAAFAAVRAAKAAEDAIEVTREIGARQLRAYVFPQTFSLLFSKRHLPPNIVIVTKNSGQTPAFNCTHVAHMFVGPFPLPDGLPPIPTGLRFANPIGPGVEMSKRLIGPTMSADTIFVVEAGFSAIYVHGRIEYEDFTGEPRSTSYAYYTTGYEALRAGVMTAYQDGHEST